MPAAPCSCRNCPADSAMRRAGSRCHATTLRSPPTEHAASRAAGASAPPLRVAVTDGTLRGGRRDAGLAFGPVGLRVEGNTVARARGTGVHIRAADRGQPVVDTHVVHNTIADGHGPAVFVD